jgi:flagellar motor switch protein FliG
MADPDNSADGYATEALRQEMAAMTSTQRAAVLMLLLGEEQASDIIRFLKVLSLLALLAHKYKY